MKASLRLGIQGGNLSMIYGQNKGFCRVKWKRDPRGLVMQLVPTHTSRPEPRRYLVACGSGVDSGGIADCASSFIAHSAIYWWWYPHCYDTQYVSSSCYVHPPANELHLLQYRQHNIRPKILFGSNGLWKSCTNLWATNLDGLLLSYCSRERIIFPIISQGRILPLQSQ